MNLPSLQTLVAQLNTLPPELALVLFFLTGATLVVIKDWRVSIVALLVQYLSMGLVLIRLVRPEIAFAKVMVGLFICLMLYLSARQASWRDRLTRNDWAVKAVMGTRFVAGEVFPPGRAFRIMAVLLLAVAALALAQTYPISSLPATVTASVYWLALVGGLLLMLTENPLKVGQGLLTIIIGFELWYTTLEGSLLVVGLWGMVNLMLALVIGYLSAVRSVQLEEEF